MPGTTAPNDGDPTSSRATLGRICAELEQIRALTAAAGPAVRGAAEGVLARLREGGDISAAQDELHRLLRRAGVAGGLNGITRGVGVGGIPPTPGHPTVPAALVCPVSRCPRAVLLDDPPELPRDCRLHGLPMRLLPPPA
ncbi:hypothetical protein RM844_25775 [Streptomyces sp. DSM 44915]|uniref:Uncharacterized protein n=1 Tax=Streptomyces chisholmiae TaxID=3075540 RepID=A0ABU2JY68_9ACTN|nr:hypothetical protein [Streptomyces sp. DSM 44915]MDT0269698.1 hypothetical protein [Streptomyces sp. DSM 44915]